MTGRLQERDEKQPGDDIPLIVLDPTEERTDLVLEGFASEPEQGEFQCDADTDEGNEPTSSNSLVSGHDADQVAAGHEDEEQPPRFGDCLFEPFVDRRQIADLSLGPTDGALAVPTTQIEEHDRCEQDAQETDHRIRKGIDEWHRAEQISISRSKDQDRKRMLVDQGRTDVRSDGSGSEEHSGGDDDRATGSRTDRYDGCLPDLVVVY